MNVSLVVARTVLGMGVGAGRALLVCAYICALLGAVIGANQAATATTLDEATVPADALEDVDVTSEEIRNVDRPLVPDQLEPRGSNPFVRGLFETAVRAMLRLAFVVANTVGLFLYVHAWVPRVVVKGALYLGLAPLFAAPLLRLRRLGG